MFSCFHWSDDQCLFFFSCHFNCKYEFVANAGMTFKCNTIQSVKGSWLQCPMEWDFHFMYFLVLSQRREPDTSSLAVSRCNISLSNYCHSYPSLFFGKDMFKLRRKLMLLRGNMRCVFDGWMFSLWRSKQFIRKGNSFNSSSEERSLVYSKRVARKTFF